MIIFIQKNKFRIIKTEIKSDLNLSLKDLTLSKEINNILSDLFFFTVKSTDESILKLKAYTFIRIFSDSLPQ